MTTAAAELLAVHLRLRAQRLERLFNTLDPFPFRHRNAAQAAR